MADKTPNERRLQDEAELDKQSRFGIDFRYGERGPVGRALDKLLRVGDGYGTSRSAAARASGAKEAERIYKTEDKTIAEVMDDKRPRAAMREAAAEERRESRGFKKGGAVKAKGWGMARGSRAAKIV